jgi:voltage-gated potassium channel
MARYAESIRLLWVVVERKRRDLFVSLSAAWVTLVLSATAMYFLERGAQPEAFSSIPATLWWGVVTLTTVGYGDVYPVTVAGRAVGGLVAVVGVGLVALPAGIIGEGLVEAANERARTGGGERENHGRDARPERSRAPRRGRPDTDHDDGRARGLDGSDRRPDPEAPSGASAPRRCPHCGHPVGAEPTRRE